MMAGFILRLLFGISINDGPYRTSFFPLTVHSSYNSSFFQFKFLPIHISHYISLPTGFLKTGSLMMGTFHLLVLLSAFSTVFGYPSIHKTIECALDSDING